MSAPLGNCIWCGHSLVYWNPGNPQTDGETDWPHFYCRGNVWRDYSLIDVPLVYGKFCPYAPAHPLGQASIHQLAGNIEQP